MKKCDQVKDLILTDFIDGQLDKDAAASVENHLLDCGHCRLFFKEVRNNAAMPFKQAMHQPVPEGLWDAIKQNIEDESQRSSPFADFIGQFKGFLALPKMVPVFASLMLMLLAGSVSLNTIQVQQARDTDQGEYLVSLLSPTASLATSDGNDGATPIEHYFL